MQSSRSRSSPAGQRRLKSSAVWHLFDFTSLQTSALRYYLNKYNVLSQPFVDSKGDEIDLLKPGHLVSIIPIKEVKFMLDDFFCLTLDDGSKFTVKFLEWKLLALFYEIKFNKITWWNSFLLNLTENCTSKKIFEKF